MSCTSTPVVLQMRPLFSLHKTSKVILSIWSHEKIYHSALHFFYSTSLHNIKPPSEDPCTELAHRFLILMRKLKVNYTWDLYHGPALIWTLLGLVMYMGVKWTRSTLVKIMTCCLFITKPLSKLTDTDHQWERKNDFKRYVVKIQMFPIKKVLLKFLSTESDLCCWCERWVNCLVKGRLTGMGTCLINKHIFMRGTSCCEKFCLNEFCHSGQANMYMPWNLTGLL